MTFIGVPILFLSNQTQICTYIVFFFKLVAVNTGWVGIRARLQTRGKLRRGDTIR